MNESTPKTVGDAFIALRKSMGHTWPVGTFMSDAQLRRINRKPLYGPKSVNKATPPGDVKNG